MGRHVDERAAGMAVALIVVAGVACGGDTSGTDQFDGAPAAPSTTVPTTVPTTTEVTTTSVRVDGTGPEELCDGLVLDVSLAGPGGPFDPNTDIWFTVVFDIEGLPDDAILLTHVIDQQTLLTVDDERLFRIDTRLPANWRPDPDTPARLTSPDGGRRLVRRIGVEVDRHRGRALAGDVESSGRLPTVDGDVHDHQIGRERCREGVAAGTIHREHGGVHDDSPTFHNVGSGHGSELLGSRTTKYSASTSVWCPYHHTENERLRCRGWMRAVGHSLPSTRAVDHSETTAVGRTMCGVGRGR